MPTATVSGCRSGAGPLTWGQRGILRILTMLGEEAHHENLAAWAAMPTGTDVAAAMTRIRRVVAGFDVLRTRYVERGGDTVQVLDGDGGVDVELVDIGGQPLDAAVRDIQARLRETRFRLAEEWPIRIALLVRDGAVTGVVLVGSHLVADAWGLRRLTSALSDAQPPADLGTQPLDQAAYEASPAGLAANERSMRYWHDQLTGMPQTLFPGPARPPHEGSRFWYAEFRSPALSAALEVLARRHRATTSSLLYTAICAALAGNAGTRCATMGIVSANRARAGMRTAVGQFAQLVPVTLPVGGHSWGELVPAAAHAGLLALRHGWYDPRTAAQVTAELEHARGMRLDLSLWFNDARSAGAATDRAAADVTALDRGRADWCNRTNEGDSTVFVYVSGEPGRTAMYVMFDTHRLSLTDAERLLADAERIVVDAVGQRDAVDLRGSVRWSPSGTAWLLVDNSWVDPGRVESLLRRCGDWAAAWVGVDTPIGGREQLVAYLAPRAGRPTPAQVHEQCLRVLPDVPGAIAPQHYVICATPPAGAGDDLGPWRRQPVLLSGSGR